MAPCPIARTMVFLLVWVVILVWVFHDSLAINQLLRDYPALGERPQWCGNAFLILIMTLFIGMRSICGVQQLRRYRSIRFAFKARITGLERVYRRAVIKRLSGTQSLEMHQCSNR